MEKTKTVKKCRSCEKYYSANLGDKNDVLCADCFKKRAVGETRESAPTERKAWYLVYSKNNGVVANNIENYIKATRIADNFAGGYPNEEFFVFRAISSVEKRSNPVVWKKFLKKM